MDKLASSVFRRYFAKLDQPTTVTVNGHKIGTWVPVASEGPTQLIPETPGGPPYPAVANYTGVRPLTEVEGTVEPSGQPARPMTQSEKDAILRRVNKLRDKDL